MYSNSLQTIKQIYIFYLHILHISSEKAQNNPSSEKSFKTIISNLKYVDKNMNLEIIFEFTQKKAFQTIISNLKYVD